MRFTGRLSRNKRGVGSIVGGTFIVLILVSGFLFYALVLNITQHYNDTVDLMGEADWNRSREQLVIKDVRITSAKKLNVTVENKGSVSSHLVWLGIFNKTATPESQQYSALSEEVEPAETRSIFSDFAVVKGKKYVVQIVTELGNLAENKFYPASAVNCALTLVTVSPTAYQGNNVTVLLTVTNNDTEVDTIQNLTISLQTDPSALVQVKEQPSPLTIESLAQGQSAFFRWIYPTTTIGTVLFNATYDQGPAGMFSISTVTITTAPTGGQGQITITGQNGGASYNPSLWNLLGGTQFISGSVSDLASDDASYLAFRSYSSGSLTNMTLLDDGFEGADWDGSWDQYGVTDWVRTIFPVHSGTWSAWGTGSSTTLTSDDLNTSGGTHLYVEFWFMKDDIENNEFILYYWDGSQYDLIQDLDLLGSDDVWIRYVHDITDNQYFREDFHVRFDCTPISGTGENVWVDDVLIKKQVGSEEYTAEVEFIGSSNLENWSRLLWQIYGAWDVGQVAVTIQFFNFTLGDFTPNGNGYTSYISSTTPNVDELKSQSIDLNQNDFKNSTGYWRVKIKGAKATSIQFLMKIDWIDSETTYTSAGDSLLYNAWQWFTIKASSADGTPIPYAYISVYANGTNLTFRNAVDKSSVQNPGWVRLDANGEYQLELRSTNASGELFLLYSAIGDVVGTKAILQEIP